MTIRIPRWLAVGLVVVVVLAAAGAGVYFGFLKGSSKDCVIPTSGTATTCSTEGAVSQQEYQAQQRRKAKAKRVASQCQSQLGGLLTSLEGLNSRLDVGLPFAQYSRQVGNVSVAYDQVSFHALGPGCVSSVAVQAEDALNDYVKAGNAWNGCIKKFSCRMSSVTPQLQAFWSKASTSIDEAKSGMRSLASP